jgi:hypothetical protein
MIITEIKVKMNIPVLEKNEEKNVNGKMKIINPANICIKDFFSSIAIIMVIAHTRPISNPTKIFFDLSIIFKFDPLIYFSSN